MKSASRKKAADTAKTAQAAAAEKPYEPTAQERVAIERYLARKRSTPPSPKFRVTHNSNVAILDPDHPDPMCATAMLADALGSGDFTFATAVLDQLAHVASKGKNLTAGDLNAALAMIHAIAPRDPTEALLATQMVAIHSATIVAARRLNRVETVDQQDSASNMLNKLARTFAMQLEALKRYRSTGEQKVTVQHVNVSAHQAIVGVRQGGGEGDEKANQSHAPEENRTATATDAVGPALLGQEQALGAPMPLTGRQGSKSMPHARGTSRSADG